MNQENLCVLIDFENIAAGTERENLGRFNTKLVMNHLKEKGRILLSRAYGDWGRFARFKQSLLIQGISMMELTSYRGQDKNRADIALVVDAMELVYTRPHIQTFVLMSGDSDFTPLVMKLRELNKRIIGLGTRKATSRLLADSCDEFIFYDNLLKRSQTETRTEEESTDETGATPPSLTSQQAYSLLVETVTALQRDEARPVPAGMIEQFILRKHPTFDETELGHNGFKNFLESAAKRDLVLLENNEKGGGYFVSIVESTASNNAEPVITLPEFSLDLTGTWFEMLTQHGLNITNHFVRHTIAHEFVDHVLERRSQQKRSTLLFTYGDIARRCRKTSPTASISEVEHVLNALQKAGYLIGNDKKPIRSKRANFIIRKDAEELLVGLRMFYVQTLLSLVENPASVTDNPEALSELLWNDTTHVNEVIALLEALPNDQSANNETSSIVPETEPVNPEENGTTPEEITATEPETTTPVAPSSTKEKPKAQRKTTRKKTTQKTKTATPAETPATTDTPETTSESTAEESAPTEKPKRKTRAKRTTQKATTDLPTKKKTTRKAATKKTTQVSDTETSEESTTDVPNPDQPDADT